MIKNEEKYDMKIQKLGVQLYTIREFLDTPEHVRESFRRLKDLGYDQAQTAGCQIPYEEFGRIAREENLEIVGTHDKFDLMVEDFEQAYENHMHLGTKSMGIGGFRPQSIQDVKDFIVKANAIGEKMAARGGKFTYHNHSHEFVKDEEGRLVMDRLVEGLNPKTTSFVLDTYWVQHGGGDVRHWIEMLAGRIDILHLKDMAKSTEKHIITEIGNGNLYWEGIMETAEKTGVRYYVVEQDTCPGDPFDSLKISSDFIHKHFM